MRVRIGPYRKNKNRKVKIRIHSYDTWNMDHTLALIILPMLKQLRDTAHGSPEVDLEDVPEPMRLIDHKEYDYQTCFDFYHEPDLQKIQCDIHDRWRWVLDEMIWSFKQVVKDDITKNFNQQERINNGLRLFGKYYQGLWD
jgi:hypothetical protein